MLFGELFVKSENHTKPINTLREMHSYRLLKHVVHIITTGFQGVSFGSYRSNINPITHQAINKRDRFPHNRLIAQEFCGIICLILPSEFFLII
jgi:hypothetical protein